jgi:hypothetical protein
MPDGDNSSSLSAPSDMLYRLQQALVQISRGDPIVSLRTELSAEFKSINVQIATIKDATILAHEDSVRVPTQIDRAIENLQDVLVGKIELAHGTVDARLSGVREVFETQFRETAKAVELLRSATDRFPEYVRAEVGRLEKLHGEMINGQFNIVLEKIQSLSNVTTQQFTSIKDTFSEKDKAVSVGLSAQKESAAAEKASSTLASAKMEENFTKLLEQGRVLQDETRKFFDSQIADSKTTINMLASRLDRGEGKSPVTDPQLTDALRRIADDSQNLRAEIRSLASSRDAGEGAAAGRAKTTANVGMVVGLAVSATAAVTTVLAAIIGAVLFVGRAQPPAPPAPFSQQQQQNDLTLGRQGEETRRMIERLEEQLKRKQP